MTGDHAVAIGAGNTVAQANTFVLGGGVTTTQANSVVLGNASTDRAATTETGNTFNGITYSYTGAGAPAQGIVSMGSEGGERQVINVAAGKISADSTDAVNGSQLYATDVALGNVANSTVGILGGNAALGSDGTLTMSNIAGTGKNNLNEAITAARTTLTAGTNVTGVNQTQTNGAYSYKIDADGASISAASGAVTVAKGAKNANNVTNYAVDLSAATKTSLGKADTAVQSFVTQADGATAQTVNQANSQANFKSGQNITVTGDATGITVATADDVSFDSVAIGPILISTTGIDMGSTKITHLAPGSDPTDAVNVSQLTGAVAGATTEVVAGTNVTGVVRTTDAIDGHSIYTVNADGASVSAGSTAVSVTPGTKDPNNVTDYAVDLSQATKDTLDNSVQYDDGTHTSVTLGGAGATAPVVLTNVADGDLSSTSTDAVNGSQLYTTNQNVATNTTNISNNTTAINKGFNVSANNGASTHNFQLGDTVDVAAGSNIVVTQDSTTGGLTIATSATPVFTSVTTGSGANTVVMNGTGITVNGGANGPVSLTGNGLDNGGNKITNVAAGTDPTDGVNVSQLGTAVAGVKTHYYSVNDGGTPGGNHDNDGATGAYSLAAGVGTTAAGDYATAMGVGAAASGAYGTAIGASAQALGDDSVALGNMSVANGMYSTAVGSFAAAQGYASAALGNNANALGDTSLALGANSIANNANDVALGAGSVTAAANPTASATIGGTSYDFAGANPQSVVSVGSLGNERQITHVAAGQLSASSTDAINGSQLYATNQAIDAVGMVANAGWNLSANGGTPVNIAPGGTVDVAQGSNIIVTQASNGSLVIATSMAPVFTSVTTGNTVMNTGGVTITGGSNGPVSLTGNGLDNGGNKITNVAAGTDPTDAVNVSQLTSAEGGLQDQIDNINKGGSGMFQVSGDSTGSPNPTGTNSAAGGANAAASGSDSLALGNDSTASGDRSTGVGTGASASGTGSTAVGNGATASADNAVAIGSGSVAGEANTVSVGSAGNERKITNVAAGTAATDAVNVSQLKASQEGGVQYDTNADGTTNYNDVTLNSGGDGPVTIHNVARGVADNDAVNLGQLNTSVAGAVTRANNYTDQKLGELKGDINNVGNRANAGIASAIAAASLPQPYAPGQSSLGVGLGSFRGEGGIAVGLSKISENGRWILKANLNSGTRGDTGAGVGVGIVW